MKRVQTDFSSKFDKLENLFEAEEEERHARESLTSVEAVTWPSILSKDWYHDRG